MPQNLTYEKSALNLGNRLVPSGSKSLNETMLTQIYVAISAYGITRQGLPFLKIITCPTSRILKFFDLLIWHKEGKSVQTHLPDW